MQNRLPYFLQAFHFLFHFKEYTFPFKDFFKTLLDYNLLFYETEY